MVTVQDYPDDAVAAARSVLLEVLTVLGAYRESTVLVGGWVPGLTFPDAGHIGSLDIDLALDEDRISDSEYDSILESLRNAGYRDGEKPNQFDRDVIVSSGQTITVRLDLLAAEYGGTGRSNRHQKIQDIKARKARGADLAFQQPVKLTISGTLPDGGTNTVTVRVADIVPFLVMKGMALFDRKKEKDAYDIYFCLQHFPGGIAELVKEFQPWSEHRLVTEGLGKIRAKFAVIDAIGPTWAAQFVDADGEEFEIMQRDAFERVSALLDALRIAAWET